MQGLHLIGDLYGCRCDGKFLHDRSLLRTQCIRFCKEAGLGVVGDFFYQFGEAGVTGTVLLAESHLAIHTWPETLSVTLDVYVCNYSQDNSAKATKVFDRLCALLNPEEVIPNHVMRGKTDEAPLVTSLSPPSLRVS